ncbi:formylmethanofuran dehydrogenase [Xanthobacter sp. V4C-4]|uniref:formylmethanofuran dehydrogenase n=1 Tax=Xanthobacter cornucopiae TaxID=3119924 RepID=UPI00372A797A
MTSDDVARDGAERIVTDVVCAFCGLGCDDLQVAVHGRTLRPVNACGEAGRLLARADRPPPAPRIGGQNAGLDEAAAAAADLLRASRAAAFTGLGADLEGLRGLFDLAMTAGASFDHAASDGLFANLERLARRGWIASTLAELRNRCDLMVVLGADPELSFHRFFERTLPAGGADGDAAPRFVTGPRRVVVIGDALSEGARRALAGHEVIQIPVAATDVAVAAQALVARLSGRAVSGIPALEGATGDALAGLAEALKAARYAVFVWNAASLGPRDGASVAEAAASAVDVLSVTTRAAVFPLGGRDNITGAHQVALWRFGYPLRTAVGGGAARHVPELYATAAALGDADLVLHTSSFRPDPPPAFTRGPVIALAHPDTVFPREPDVFIPVGTPGVDHDGHVFRMDAVVCLPLTALRPAELPSLAQATRAILESLRRVA